MGQVPEIKLTMMMMKYHGWALLVDGQRAHLRPGSMKDNFASIETGTGNRWISKALHIKLSQSAVLSVPA